MLEGTREALRNAVPRYLFKSRPPMRMVRPIIALFERVVGLWAELSTSMHITSLVESGNGRQRTLGRLIN